MLLEDEQHVIKWLSQYGALPKTQILQMLYNKPRSTAEKIIRNLKRNMQITDVGGGYYLGLDGLCKPDQRMILAVWVLLKFINVVDPMAHLSLIHICFQRYAVRRQYHVAHGDVVVVQVAVIFHR